MAISIDGSGNLTGTIDMPDDMSTGVIPVEVIGDQGTKLLAYYVADTGIKKQDRDLIYVTNTDPYAPMAQTLTLSESRDITGVSLKFATKGSDGDVVVQIREVEKGIPTQRVICEGTIDFADIDTDINNWTDCTFPTVPLLADKEYAIIILTDNIDHSVRVAKLGDIDTITGSAITKQADQKGTLQTSSNGTAWTIHQDKDLTYKLIGSTYSTLTKEIDLGDITATNSSDYIILGDYHIPNSDSSVTFKITRPDASELNGIELEQPGRFADKQSGTYNLKAILTGTSKQSPILYQNTQLVVGEISTTGQSISTGIQVDSAFNITVYVETKNEGASSFALYIEDTSADNWTQLTLDSAQSELLPDGWTKQVFTGSSTEVGTTGFSRLKTTLSGTVSARPFIRNRIAIIH